ncbi:hypothetical protein C8F04DRAFT_1252104 [Mycena alexandri]|uniref:Uncharacterized protein n=1 Tax=Mycena alexandri TaxID=1745969 RepID=A0AAD6TA65_9AGAR|nr:hypothetical protein C8F04DRAFT_1252104 [Mycena alexandri]
MKFSTISKIVIYSVTATAPVVARSIARSELEIRLASAGPNAQRMARGLGPLPPTRRRASTAKRATASSTPISCSTKTTVCCASLEASNSPAAGGVLAPLGLSSTSTNVGVTIGLACVVPIITFGSKTWCVYVFQTTSNSVA